VKLLLTTIAAVLLVGCGPGVDIWTAAQTGNIEAVKQHLADGVDVNSKNDIGRTPLDVAIALKQSPIADLLRQHSGKTRDELKAAESIVAAIRLGNIEAIKQHLADGADVNATDEVGWTPLHRAVIGSHTDHTETAEFLIASGADVNAKDEEGLTPLHHAAWEGHKEVAELLIAAGADVNATPLYQAAYHGHKEIVELLIAEGADVNAKNKRDKTPLHQAARSGRKEIAELLIAKGADVNAKDENSLTPLDQAIQRKKTETANLLRKHGGKTGEELKAEGK